jgi:hypothetical protein
MKMIWHTKRNGAAVEHFTAVRGFNCLVTNFPGSRTLMWEVTRNGMRWGNNEDRFEQTVRSLKARCIEKVSILLEARD